MGKIDKKKTRAGYAPPASTRPGVDDRGNIKKSSPTKKNIRRESKLETARHQSPKKKTGKVKTVVTRRTKERLERQERQQSEE